MASNPLFQKTEQQNADKVSHGSTNTAMDSDSEREDAFASEGDNEETIDVETIKKLSLKKDSDGNRMNKTYV